MLPDKEISEAKAQTDAALAQRNMQLAENQGSAPLSQATVIAIVFGIVGGLLLLALAIYAAINKNFRDRLKRRMFSHKQS